MSNPTRPTTLAARLSEFSSSLQLEHVPARVRTRAKYLLLDAIGCALAARRERFAVTLVEAITGLNNEYPAPSGSASHRAVFGHRVRLPFRDAALLNGALAHGLDFDDTHVAGITHLTVSVLPAVLAFAAERGASGSHALAAYVAGVECGARIAAAANGGFHVRGFHPTGMVGVFACAIACSRLLGLGPEATTRAQGLALSMASGSLQFLEDGAWTKRIHPGWAAQSGIMAAWMAQWPIPAPSDVYEGRYGLYAAYMDAPDGAEPQQHFKGLGEHWELLNVAVKPFPICHLSHGAADASIALHRRLRSESISLDAIDRVEVLLPQEVIPVICEPIVAKRSPRTDYEAKFSLPYAVACGLVRGRLGLADLLPDSINDARLREIAQRVEYTTDRVTTFPRHYTGEVVLHLRDGRTLRHRESINRGHAERPLSNEEIVLKYEENASLYFERAAIDHLRDCVLSINSTSDLTALEAALSIDPIR